VGTTVIGALWIGVPTSQRGDEAELGAGRGRPPTGPLSLGVSWAAVVQRIVAQSFGSPVVGDAPQHRSARWHVLVYPRLRMWTMAVWKFESAMCAENALELFARLPDEKLLRIDTAAYIYWPGGRKKPKTEQLHTMTGACAGRQLVGAAFQADRPHVTAENGNGHGHRRAGGLMSDVGIADAFLRKVRREFKS
jgi:hypothetical protein